MAAAADAEARRHARSMAVRSRTAGRPRGTRGGRDQHRPARRATWITSCCRAIDDQLRRVLPTLPAPAWLKVIAERRATYACIAGIARPASGAIAPAFISPATTPMRNFRPRSKRRRAAASPPRRRCSPTSRAHGGARQRARSDRDFPARRGTPAERALHQHRVEPAIELPPNRAQQPDALEAERACNPIDATLSNRRSRPPSAGSPRECRRRSIAASSRRPTPWPLQSARTYTESSTV